LDSDISLWDNLQPLFNMAIVAKGIPEEVGKVKKVSKSIFRESS
jgi:hypothetical protein